MPTSPDFDRATPSWDEIAAHLAGELPSERSAEISAWLDVHGADEAVVKELDALLVRASKGRSRVLDDETDTEDALLRVKARRPGPTLHIVPTAPARTQEARVSPTSSWMRGAWRFAAVLGIVVIGGVLWSRRVPDVERVVAVVTYATGVGELRSVVLADSSEVTLAPASRLEVGANNGRDVRRVTLRGEARFAVRHDAGRPFVVASGGAEITDVGTVFTVRELTRGDVRVAVHEGRVRLARLGDGEGVVELSPGDAGEVTSAGVRFLPRGAAERDSAATMRRLVFADASLDVVALELRRWFGVTLRVEGTDGQAHHLTSSMPAESRDAAIGIIALTLGARASWRGDTVILRFRDR